MDAMDAIQRHFFGRVSLAQLGTHLLGTCFSSLSLVRPVLRVVPVPVPVPVPPPPPSWC
jgi:hypothetical protein